VTTVIVIGAFVLALKPGDSTSSTAARSNTKSTGDRSPRDQRSGPTTNEEGASTTLAPVSSAVVGNPALPTWIAIVASKPQATVSFDAAAAETRTYQTRGFVAQMIDSNKYAPRAYGYWAIYVGGEFPTSAAAEAYCAEVTSTGQVGDCYPANLESTR
jgi:hypothetical protein